MVKQQRSGNLKGKVTFCMPGTSSSHSIGWEHLCSCYSLKRSWFRQNPTAEGDVPHLTTRNTWILPSARLTVRCKGRTPRSPRVTAGDTAAQPREDPCMAEPRPTVPVLQQVGGTALSKPRWDPGSEPHLLMWLHLPTGTKGLTASFGLASSLLLCGGAPDAHLRSSASVTLSGANANCPHCTSFLRTTLF